MINAWVLIIGLAGGYGDSIATIPGFANQDECRQAGQAWLDKVGSLPNELEMWDGRRPAKFMCLQLPQ